jgi:hypothetical protein
MDPGEHHDKLPSTSKSNQQLAQTTRRRPRTVGPYTTKKTTTENEGNPFLVQLGTGPEVPKTPPPLHNQPAQENNKELAEDKQQHHSETATKDYNRPHP